MKKILFILGIVTIAAISCGTPEPTTTTTDTTSAAPVDTTRAMPDTTQR